MKTTTVAAISMVSVLAIYLLAYVTSKCWYPVSGDGPGLTYDTGFAPLIKSSAETPSYWVAASANGGYLEVYVEWVNEGNGYVYFTHRGSSYRAYAGGGLSDLHEDTMQRLKFTSEISTNDQFESRHHVTADLE